MNSRLASLTCPPDMAEMKCWLGWRSESRTGRDKPAKIPYWSNGERRRGKQGSPEDLNKLVTFKVAKAAAIRLGFDGVGFAVVAGSPIIALDFDDVMQDPELSAPVLRAVENTYAEYSPSGNGVRAFIIQGGDFNDEPTLQNLKSHKKNGHPFTFEIFADSGFVTFTGDVINPDHERGIHPPSMEIQRLYEERLAARSEASSALSSGADGGGTRPVLSNVAPKGYSREELQDILKALNPSCGYDEWIEVGMCIFHETEGSEEGLAVFTDWSSRGDNYVGEGDCEYHWRSFNRSKGRVKTIATLLKRASQAGAKVGSPRATADDFDDMPAEEPLLNGRGQTGEGSIKFSVKSYADYLKRPPIGWLVRGLIQEGDPVNLFGPSGSGKSFVAFDIVMAIARGIPWRGLKVKQGRVVYVCAEGAGGFRSRMDAYREYHQIDPDTVQFGVIADPPNLLDNADIEALVLSVKQEGGADVIVLDTLAQSTPGADENNSKDMGLALRAARVLGTVFEATVILIHHTGKDVTRGARGWSGIKGAMGTQLEVIQNSQGDRSLYVEKLKDGESGAAYGFKLLKVDLGVDQDGEACSSCVVVPAGGDVSQGRTDRKDARMGPWELLVLDAIERLGAQIATLPILILAALELANETSPTKDEEFEPLWRMRARIKEAALRLVKKKIVSQVDGVYFRTKM